MSLDQMRDAIIFNLVSKFRFLRNVLLDEMAENYLIQSVYSSIHDFETKQCNCYFYRIFNSSLD